jgi:hypothetical protein
MALVTISCVGQTRERKRARARGRASREADYGGMPLYKGETVIQ